MTELEDIMKKGRWIVGVSGGSDSMALLDMCYRAGIKTIAAHMNYQMRDTAKRDMDIVEEYCRQRDIPCCIKYQEEVCKHNFQDFARKKRYAFYHELIEKYHAQGVLIAHQMDDVLETFFMQEKRCSIPEYYGIKEDCDVMGCHVKRPLLGYTKEELNQYCQQNQIRFGEDESNFQRKYMRNRIRMDVIGNMTRREKEDVLKEIALRNQKRQEFLKQIKKFYKNWDHRIDSFMQLEEDHQLAVLDHMIYEAIHRHVSRKERKQIITSLSGGNFRRPIGNRIFQYSYGVLSMEKEEAGYAYVFHNVEYRKTPYFEIGANGQKIESLTLKESDFPITVRNARKEDRIRLRFGTKSVHRWFIDRKIPANERKIWPVVENAQGNIVFVVKIGCDIEHYSNNPTLFVLK